MTPERFNKIKQVLDTRQHDLTVITDEIHKQRNIAAIVRTCDAVGVDTVHCVMPREGYQYYTGTAASSEKWVEMEHHSDVCTPIMQLKDKGFQIVAANLSDRAVDYRQIDYTKPTALVMGAEIEGISDKTARLTDAEIILPMKGMVESFNVSVACALILNEAMSQREEAGLYNRVSLPEEIYNKRFFEWAHPKLTEYCQQKKLPYPPLRSDGELADPVGWYKSVM